MGKLQLAKRIRDLIEEIRWEDATSPSRWGMFVRKQVRLYFYIAMEMIRDHCPQRAAALTFTTLLSLVPMLAVAFSLFRAFEAFQGLEKKAERVILRTMLSDVFVRGATLPAEDEVEQEGDEEPEARAPLGLIAEADGLPRMAGAGDALRLYLNALASGADATSARKGLGTLYLGRPADVLERFAAMDPQGLLAYAGAADAPTPPASDKERLKEGRDHFGRARSLEDGRDYEGAIEELRYAEAAGYPFRRTRRSMGLIHQKLAEQARGDGDLSPDRQLEAVIAHCRQAAVLLTDALVLSAADMSADAASRVIEEHNDSLDELGKAVLALGKLQARSARQLSEGRGDDPQQGEDPAEQMRQAAITSFKRAALLREADQEPVKALADLLWDAGRTEEAHKYYQAALHRGDAQAAQGLSTVVVDTIHELAEGVGDARFTAVGLLLLFVAATSLLGTMEKTLNHIWQVRQRRPRWVKFTSFCTLLLLGPAMLAVAIIIRERLSYAMESTFEGLPVLGPVFSIAASVGQYVLPFIIFWAVLFVLYKFLPYTKVRIVPALWGAFVATALLQMARPTFRIYVTSVFMAGSKAKLYGSLGAVPLLMLWLWILWLVVLFGAEIAFTVQNLALLQFREKQIRFSRMFIDGFLAARIVMYVGREFWRVGKPLSADRLAQTLNISAEEAKDAAHRLVNLKLLTPVGEDMDEFHPARDLSRLKVIDVLTVSDRFRHQSRSVREEDKAYEDELEALFDAVIESRQAAVRDMTFHALMETCDAKSPHSDTEAQEEDESEGIGLLDEPENEDRSSIL